jgi:hypothetical protein
VAGGNTSKGLCAVGMKASTSTMMMGIFLLAFSVVAFAQDEVTVKGTVTSVNLEMRTFVVTTHDGKEIRITIDDRARKKFDKG